VIRKILRRKGNDIAYRAGAPTQGLAPAQVGFAEAQIRNHAGVRLCIWPAVCALIGTLNAWLGEVGVKLATIGVLSWIGLSYSFKFLWSPLVDRFRLPGLDRLGRRKSWILCQGLLVAGFFGLAVTDPAHAIGVFALCVHGRFGIGNAGRGY
jgi:hypothetical protein